MSCHLDVPDKWLFRIHLLKLQFWIQIHLQLHKLIFLQRLLFLDLDLNENDSRVLLQNCLKEWVLQIMDLHTRFPAQSTKCWWLEVIWLMKFARLPKYKDWTELAKLRWSCFALGLEEGILFWGTRKKIKSKARPCWNETSRIWVKVSSRVTPKNNSL